MKTAHLNGTKVIGKMTHSQFVKFCQSRNNELDCHRYEHLANGTIVAEEAAGGSSGKRESESIFEVQLWNVRTNANGTVFSSSTGFKLPNGATRSPDSAWLSNEKYNQLSNEDKEKFLPLCPEFIIEIRSKSDSLQKLLTKMQEWKDNGCVLGWLIDPYQLKSYIFRKDIPRYEIVEGFDRHLSGEDLLIGFMMDLRLLK